MNGLNRREVFHLCVGPVWRMFYETSAISDSTKSYSHSTIQQLRNYFPEPSTIISADLSEIKSTNTKRTKQYKSVHSENSLPMHVQNDLRATNIFRRSTDANKG